MSISATLVKELRERTGAGMMECKKALVAVDGDIDKAIEEMRKAGQAKAAKRAGKIVAEGVILIDRSDDGKTVAIVEVNSETDFVARDESFNEFANNVLATVLQTKEHDLVKLAETKMINSQQTIEEIRQQLIVKIGENIKINRVKLIQSDKTVGFYTHGNRIGVVVEVEGGDENLAKDLAMHVAASNPVAVNSDEVDPSLIETEKNIAQAQAENSGKPADIVEKMVTGRVNKFLKEVTLLGQPFVKDPNITVEKLLQQNNAKVQQFTRFEVGEGIEKEEGDFVAEVMAQARGE